MVFITVPDEADDCSVACNLHELDRVMKGEEQWGEHITLGGTGAESDGVAVLLISPFSLAVAHLVRKLAKHGCLMKTGFPAF